MEDIQFVEDFWNTLKMASSCIEEAMEMNLMSSPLLGDGSWELRVLVTDLQVERTIRVKGDLHLGGVMLKLVDELGRTSKSIVLIIPIPLLGLFSSNIVVAIDALSSLERHKTHNPSK